MSRAEKSSTRPYDQAYGLYLFCGLGVLLATLTFPPTGTENLVPFELALPLGILFGLGAPGALVIAGILTVKLRHHWPLPVLALITAVYLYLEFTYGDTEAPASTAEVSQVGTLLAAARWLYVISTLGWSSWWFTFERPRRLQSRSRPDDPPG